MLTECEAFLRVREQRTVNTSIRAMYSRKSNDARLEYSNPVNEILCATAIKSIPRDNIRGSTSPQPKSRHDSQANTKAQTLPLETYVRQLTG